MITTNLAPDVDVISLSSGCYLRPEIHHITRNYSSRQALSFDPANARSFAQASIKEINSMACNMNHNISHIHPDLDPLFSICNHDEKRLGFSNLIPFEDFNILTANPFSETKYVLVPLCLIRYKNSLYHNLHTITK